MGETNTSKTSIRQIFETMEYGNDFESVAPVTVSLIGFIISTTPPTNTVQEWLKKRENRIFAYIDKKNETPTGEIVPVKNTTNDQHLCDVHVPDATTVDTILKKSANAKNTWKDIPAAKRAEIIYK